MGWQNNLLPLLMINSISRFVALRHFDTLTFFRIRLCNPRRCLIATDSARASPHFRECGQVRRKQTRRCVLRFLSLTLALPFALGHTGFCKAGNLKENLVSFGIFSTFADIIQGGQTIRHLLVEYLFPNLLLYARPSISVTYKFVVE